MQRLTVNLWMQGNAEEAGQFYASALPNTTTEIESRYPTDDLAEFQQPLAGQALTVSVWVGGTKLTLINAGSEFSPTPAISLMLNFDPSVMEDATAQLDATWAALSEGGTVLMPLGEYPFSQRYGWIADRYGVTWQLILSNPAGEPAPLMIPNLMFAGAAQNRAAEAVELYTSLLGGSIKAKFNYEQANDVVTADSVMFCDFTLGDDIVSAMDSGVAQDLNFTPGVSLQWDCDGQEEIDRVWDALSAVPEAEQCGWLTDKFGVSWQIVPSNMGELMSRPNAFEHMMNMKKLIIADF